MKKNDINISEIITRQHNIKTPLNINNFNIS